MAPVLLFLFTLMQFKPAFFFLPPLLTGTDMPFNFILFVLKLQRLLCLCAGPRLMQLLFDFPLHPFRVDPPIDRTFHDNRRAEFQPVPVLEQKIVKLPVLWLRSERDLACFVFSAALPLVNTNPERVFKKHGQFR